MEGTTSINEDTHITFNVRGERIVTTASTLLTLAVHGSFFCNLESPRSGTGSDEIFLDYDAAAVRFLLDAHVAARLSLSEAIAVICDAAQSKAHEHTLRMLLHFVGLEWMLGSRFSSVFDDDLCEASCVSREDGSHPSTSRFGIIHHLMRVHGVSNWHELPQFALINEFKRIIVVRDFNENGNYVPVGPINPWNQLRLVFDAGHGNAIRPTGIRAKMLIPTGHVHGRIETFNIEVTIEGVSEFSAETSLLECCVITTCDLSSLSRQDLDGELRPEFSLDSVEHIIGIPIPTMSRHFFRMVRLNFVSSQNYDRHGVGCLKLDIYGDLVHNMPSEMLSYPRGEHVFETSYDSYWRDFGGQHRDTDRGGLFEWE